MNKARKQFAYEFVEGRVKIRTLFNSATMLKYNPAIHFLPFEESDYLMEALRGHAYATFTTDNTDAMKDLLQNGYRDKVGTTWVSLFAYWKDQEGHAILVPETAFGMDPDLRNVGVLTDMAKPADFMKVGKYANRLFAALPKVDLAEGQSHAVWGKEVSYNPTENESIVLVDAQPGSDLSEDDRTLSVLYVELDTLTEEQKAIVDGALLVSEKACRALDIEKEPMLGMAWRVTIGTQRGLGKGHAEYKNDLNVDIVIYGPKKILKTDRFFFGNMGPLHVGIPHTDRQAAVNFHMHRKGLMVKLAKDFMQEVLAASTDESSMRQVFLKYTKDDPHATMDNEAWILRRALAYGVSFLRFPGLYRRVVRYLMKRVMQCDQRARIPMDKVAAYAYVLPDPNVFDSEGGIHPEWGIKEGTIVFPDEKPGTKVVCYRQPSENTNAWVPLTVTYKPEYKRFAGRGICLLGQGAHKVLSRLGGGDMDDSFVIVHDPAWVEAFHTMRPYPETEKLSADTEEDNGQDQKPRTAVDMDTDDLLEDITVYKVTYYTKKHVSWQIDMAKSARAGIGPVVNYGVIDMLLSDPDHKASMLKDLWHRNPEGAEWLENRDDYQAALFMTNLEIVIDGNVKDTTLLQKLGDVSGTIKKFHDTAEVYPASQEGRIPDRRVEVGGYVIARSLFCHALEQIRNLREQMDGIFREREWALVTPADKDLRVEFPQERELVLRVAGIKRRIAGEWTTLTDGEHQPILSIWAEEWKNRDKKESIDVAYKRIVTRIAEEVYGEDDAFMQRIAVELYYQTYRTWGATPKVDEETGELRGFSDGLLWSPLFANHFINALRKARLSGYYLPVDLRPELRRRLMDTRVKVAVRNHSVYVLDSNDEYKKFVGFVLARPGQRVPDVTGVVMDGGLIEFRAGSPIVQPADPDLVALKPVTRLIPKAEEPKAVEPKGIMGKLLKKALDVLK